MKPFSKIKLTSDEMTSKKDNSVYSSNGVNVAEFDGWTFIDESDMVVCLIYLIEENKFLLRMEYIPPFKFKDSDDYFLTSVGGTIEGGETPERALLREIEEEAGIVIRPDFNIEFLKPLFVCKSSSAKYHPSIVTLTERDYHEVVAKGDGSKYEKMSKTVKIDTSYLNSINPSDIITQYLVDKFKEYINIK